MDDAAFAPARYKLDVDEYFRMAEGGVFAKEIRIELIEGDLIDMAPIGQEHEALVNGLNEAFVVAFAGRAIVSPQNSVRIDRLNAPQPDLAILKRRADFYAKGERAGPADVLLLVEVADTSLHYDRTVKLPLYARAGIAEVWIVDIKRQAIDVHRAPGADGYGEVTTHRAGDRVSLVLAPEIDVKLDLVFG